MRKYGKDYIAMSNQLVSRLKEIFNVETIDEVHQKWYDLTYAITMEITDGNTVTLPYLCRLKKIKSRGKDKSKYRIAFRRHYEKLDELEDQKFNDLPNVDEEDSGEHRKWLQSLREL